MSKKKVNKKVASEFAIGVVVLVAVAVGGFIWLKNSRDIALVNSVENQQAQISKNNNMRLLVAGKADKSGDATKADSVTCTPHYYEGDVKVEAQFVSQEADGIVIAIKKTYAADLPVTNYKPSESDQNFKVKLVDATDKVSTSLKASSENKLATLDVQGYAEVCQSLPLVSLQPATVAFKK